MLPDAETPSSSEPSTPVATTPRMVRVLRFRIKDKHVDWLSSLAREVNTVWNYCNDLSVKVFERERRFMSGFDLQKYLNGSSKAGLQIGSPVFQQVAEEYATRRRQHKKVRLSWRKSRGVRRSLGWVPFKARAVEYRGGQIRFNGAYLSIWDSYGLADYLAGGAKLRAGNFSEDARGRWHLNVSIETAEVIGPPVPRKSLAVGVDLGLKDLAVFSDGHKVAAETFYRDLEPCLAVAQRARKKGRTKAIHAKIANRRNDFLHKVSTAMVKDHRCIFVGNVNASALAKTSMAKSVLDAGWSSLRTMLRYKCDDAGVWFEEVNEAFSTQTCSACGERTGPRGPDGLNVRLWTCLACGEEHDRDVNAARNILLAGLAQMSGSSQQSAPSRPGRKTRSEVRVSNEAGLSPAGAGHGPLAEGISH